MAQTAERPLVLGVDLSTQSCTVELRDAWTFEVVTRKSSPLPDVTPPVSEQNPADWWSALSSSLRSVSEDGVDLSAVSAMSTSGQCHGLVPLDEAGEVIRPAKLWNDTTSAQQAADLVERFGMAYWADRVGIVPSAAPTISKLAWLLDNEPQTIERLRTILLPHDYLNFRLTGEFCTDRSEASGTAYFDSFRNVYDLDLLRDCFGDPLPWDSLFPEVRGPSDLAGTVTAAAADELGIPEGIPVAIGGGDQHVGALGLGIGEGDVIFSLGTSGVVMASSTIPVRDHTGAIDGVANTTGGWLPLVCTLNCTKTTDWVADLLGVSVQELDRLAESVVDGAAHRPVFATFLDGERSPRLPESMGVMAGLTRGAGRPEVALAAFEGVLMGLVRGLDGLAAEGVAVDGRILVVGGGAKSSVYLQVLADMVGREVHTLGTSEATVRGACVQAFAAHHEIDVATASARVAPEIKGTTFPRAGAAGWADRKQEYLSVAEYAATTKRDGI